MWLDCINTVLHESAARHVAASLHDCAITVLLLCPGALHAPFRCALEGSSLNQSEASVLSHLSWSALSAVLPEIPLPQKAHHLQLFRCHMMLQPSF